MLDTHLDFLDTDIPSEHFLCLQDLFKTSSRHVFKMSLRRLQDNNSSSSKTSSKRLAKYIQDVFKVSSRCFQDVLCLQDVFKMSWKTKSCYAEEMLKTSSRHVLKSNKCLMGMMIKECNQLIR